MNTKRRRLLSIMIAASLTVLALTGCGLSSAGSTEGPATVSVPGYGEASDAPDMVSIQLGISESSSNVSQAVELTNSVTEAIKAAVLALGIEEADIQTTNYSVWPEERFDPMTGISTGERIYHVDSTLMITMRDVSLLGTVIGDGLDAGANNVYGINFGMQNADALQAEARTEAVADARARAEQLAQDTGLTLGEVLSIQEGVVSGSYAGYPAAEAAFGIGGGGAPISSGELQVSVQVQITFALQP